MRIVRSAPHIPRDFFSLLRPLPAYLPALGPHQTLSSRPHRGRGVGGPYLDGATPGRHQQREQLRHHEGLRPEQAG